MNTKETKCSSLLMLILLLVTTVSNVYAYGCGPMASLGIEPITGSHARSPSTTGDREVDGASTRIRNRSVLLSHHPVTRANFLRSVAVTTGVGFLLPVSVVLVSNPSAAVAKTAARAPPQDPAAQVQSGFDSLNKEAKKLDRVVQKEAKTINRVITKKTQKMDRVVTKKTKKITKELKKGKKKVDRAVTKQRRRVMTNVDNEARGVQREVKKIGNTVEKETKTFMNKSDMLLPPEAANIGINVSRVKVCKDLTKKCL